MEAQTTGQWLPVFEAAQTLGAGETEVRRLISYNLLRRRHRDGQVEVWVGPDTRLPELTSEAADTSHADEVVEEQLELFAAVEENVEQPGQTDTRTELAWQRAEHAGELLALARHEGRRLRQHLIAAWSVAAVLLLAALWPSAPAASDAHQIQSMQNELTELRQQLAQLQSAGSPPATSTAFVE